jgi:hypothetical protein
MLTRKGFRQRCTCKVTDTYGTQCCVQIVYSVWMHKVFVSPVRSKGGSQLCMQIFVQYTWHWSTGFVPINWQSGISCHWTVLSVCLSVSPATCHYFDVPDYLEYSVLWRRGHRCSRNVGFLVIHSPDAAAIPRISVEISRRGTLRFFFCSDSTQFRVTTSPDEDSPSQTHWTYRSR